MTTGDKSYLSVQDVAGILGISKNTVYELIKRGELSSYRVGKKLRVDRKDIEEYKNRTRMGSHKTETPEPAQPAYTHQEQSGAGRTSQQFAGQDAFTVCGQDILLDLLTKRLSGAPYHIPALRYYTGSYNGLVELYNRNVSIASAHLWHSNTDTYNVPYLDTLLPGVPCVLVNLTYRMQGLYVQKGNPKNILSWEDFQRGDIRMMNRELGCGVRVLTDQWLRKLGIPTQAVNGYENVAFSHISVASAVARGQADVAIGNQKTASQVENIDFIPLQRERLDLVIPKDMMGDYRYRAVLEILNDPEFHAEIMGIGGYEVSETGKVIAET